MMKSVENSVKNFSCRYFWTKVTYLGYRQQYFISHLHIVVVHLCEVVVKEVSENRFHSSKVIRLLTPPSTFHCMKTFQNPVRLTHLDVVKTG